MTAVARGAFGASKATALNFQPMPAMQEFLDQLVAEGRSASHIRTCRAALHYLTENMRTQNVYVPQDITRQHLVLFQGWMNSQPWKSSYKIELLKKVKHWLSWLVNVRYLRDTPWIGIRMGVTIKQPKPLSEDELAELFARHRQDAFSVTPFAYHRRETILVMLYGWGLRIHELCALDIGDLSIEKEFVRAINKGGTFKTLPYLDDIKNSWRRYETWRVRHAKPDELAAFINRGGTRMRPSDVWEIVHDLGERAGVRVNPHRFRDTCATRLLDEDVAVERVAQILGHKNIKTTLGYGKVNDHKVAEALNAAMGEHINGLIFGRTKNLGTP
jgi:integrase/recombinase XerD